MILENRDIFDKVVCYECVHDGEATDEFAIMTFKILGALPTIDEFVQEKASDRLGKKKMESVADNN